MFYRSLVIKFGVKCYRLNNVVCLKPNEVSKYSRLSIILCCLYFIIEKNNSLAGININFDGKTQTYEYAFTCIYIERGKERLVYIPK